MKANLFAVKLGLLLFLGGILSGLSGCIPVQQLPGIVTNPPPGVTLVAAPSATALRVLPESGSATPAPTNPNATKSAAISPTPSPLPSDTAEPTPTQAVLPGYVIDASMDYAAKTLEVEQQIDYPNTSAKAIDEITLAVQPNRTNGVFELSALNSGGSAIADYTLDGQKLSWKLPQSLAPGAALEIKLSYRLTLPVVEQGDPNVIRPQIFGVTERQVNLTDWYAMVLPYNEESGWVLHDPWYYGEHLVYPLANFDISLHFKDAANQPTIAASAEAEDIHDGKHFVLENGRDFALAMGMQMKVVSASVDDVTINSYYYPGNEEAAQAVLEQTGKAVRVFSDLFGPYPHKTLAAVQGDFNDGMEFDGLYYLSNSFYNLYDGSNRNYLVMVAAHETSHQWWFGRVASDQNNEPWLDEALATYCEKLFYEKTDPDAVNWWWSYRVDFYQPAGKIDGSVPSYEGFAPYTNATYRRGAHFLEDLRKATGDEAFFAFLKDYAAQMNGKIASKADFFRILKTHSQADLSDLLAEYFSK